MKNQDNLIYLRDHLNNEGHFAHNMFNSDSEEEYFQVKDFEKSNIQVYIDPDDKDTIYLSLSKNNIDELVDNIIDSCFMGAEVERKKEMDDGDIVIKLWFD